MGPPSGFRLPPGVVFPQQHSWPTILQAGALVLRPLTRRDAERWRTVRTQSRRWLTPWDATMPPESQESILGFSEMVRMHNRHGKRAEGLAWVLAWDEGWQQQPNPRRAPLIGQLTVAGIAWGSARNANIGYWIDRNFAGRGLMTTAVAMASDYCFAVLRLHRIEICIRPENQPSLRVVQKLGFRYEGSRPRFLHIDGGWRDHEIFALNVDEIGPGLLSRYLEGRELPGS